MKPPRIYVSEVGHASRFFRTLGSALTSMYDDGTLGIAKGVAYSGLLSFFPVLTTLAAVLVQVRANDVSRIIAGTLYRVVPPGTETVVRDLFLVHGEKPKWLLVIAVALAVWAASGAMVSMFEGFRAIYRIPSGRSFLHERAMAIMMVFFTAFPVLGASALIVAGRRAERHLIHWMRLESIGSEWVLLLGQVLRLGLGLGAFVLVTALLYYFGPNRKQSFANVFPGAVLATLLWLVSTSVFGLYVSHVTDYNVLYGSVGAGLALLVWIYVLAIITLLGCEYNAAREKNLTPTAK